MKRIALLVMVALLACGLAFAGGAKEGAAKQGKAVRIDVISMGFQHEYWQTVKLGTEKAAKELGLEVPFFGPAVETEVDVQMNMFENSMAKKVDAILLAPCDSEALVPLAEKATKAGIVVATFDVDLNNPDFRVSFIATDNFAAGKLAGQKMGELLAGKGKVGVIGHIAATMDTRERVGGFVEAIKEKFPGVTLLETVYGDGDHKKSMDKATDMMTAHPDLAAIYATNEGGAIGVALAVEAAGKVGKVQIVGFDSSEQEIDYLQKGIINGFVVQNPFQMGYIGVKTLYEHLAGAQKAPGRIDTGVVWVDMKNFGQADIQKVLFPLK